MSSKEKGVWGINIGFTKISAVTEEGTESTVQKYSTTEGQYRVSDRGDRKYFSSTDEEGKTKSKSVQKDK